MTKKCKDYNELLASNAELEASNARMRDALVELISIVEIHSKGTDNNFAWAELEYAREVMTEEPDQSLNLIKAAAIDEAIEATRASMHEGQPEWLCRVQDLEEYAAKLRSDD